MILRESTNYLTKRGNKGYIKRVAKKGDTSHGRLVGEGRIYEGLVRCVFCKERHMDVPFYNVRGVHGEETNLTGNKG